jgi:hypothetical protein
VASLDQRAFELAGVAHIVLAFLAQILDSLLGIAGCHP